MAIVLQIIGGITVVLVLGLLVLWLVGCIEIGVDLEQEKK